MNEYWDGMEPDPREAKLPVWVRAGLGRLRSTVVNQRGDIAELCSKWPESRIQIKNYAHEHQNGIPEQAHIFFDLGDDGVLEISLEERNGRTGIYVYTYGMSNTMSIHPQSGNGVLICSESRRQLRMGQQPDS